MKKLIFITLILVFFFGKPTSGKSVRQHQTYEDYNEFVKDVKKTIIIERPYKIGTEENLVLAPGQAARLDFEDKAAAIKEFIFYYDGKIVHLILRDADDANGKYRGIELYPEKPKSYRSIYATGAPLIHVFYGFKPEDDKAFVKFRTTMSLSEKDREEIKEIDKARKHRMAEEIQAISELEWDFAEKIEPSKIIMDDPNDPNMVMLRNKYDMEGLVCKAADDYEKLRLILGWVQKQWKHHGNNKPSKSDPLTILKEASEGKKFRCVEYAIVVAACTRSLGMPSRKLGLKRSDVETAKSGAGHVVAEVWLKQLNKWVFVDGQWGAIPEMNEVPLNAVEFQDAIARKMPGLKIRFATKENEKEYLAWVAPYLYYFDFNLDQRFYNAETQEERISGSRGKIMLVPKGAKNPKVFQRKSPIKNCTYISNPKAFYPQMNR